MLNSPAPSVGTSRTDPATSTHAPPAGGVALAGFDRTAKPPRLVSQLVPASQVPAPRTFLDSGSELGSSRPGSSSGSTAANFYVNGSECSFDERATQLGRSPDSLATLVLSSYSLYNGSSSGAPCIPSRLAISPFFFSHGALEVARSTDSGRSWTDSWPNTAAAWWGNGTLNNSVYGGFGGIASDQLSPVDASTVVLAGDFGGACYVLQNLVGPKFQPGCTADVLVNTSTGVAVDRSVDGARSWGNATAVMQVPAFVYLSSPCGAGYYQGNITQEPSIVLNPVNHHALLTWDIYSQGYNTTNCTFVKLKVTAYRSTSIDGGLSWSPPTVIGRQTNGSFPVAAIGPAPTYAMSVVLNDDTNGSVATKISEGTHSLLYVESDDNGSSWSSPDIIRGNKVGNTTGSASNTALYFPEYPTIAYDNWSRSPFRGNLYIAYGNNETGGVNFGNPGINVIVRHPGNASWVAPLVLVDPNHALTLWDPAIAVASGGIVWVTFVGVGIYTGLYREYGIVSSDGGSSWSSIIALDDVASVPGYVTGLSITSLLFNFGLVGTSNGTYAGWTDCRQKNCTSTFDLEAFMAQLFPANVTTNAPNLVLGVTTFGLFSNLTLSSSTTALTGWPSGSLHALLAPLYVASNQSGQIEGFQGFSGLVVSNNSSASFVTTSGGTLRVSYQSELPAHLAGTLVPNVPQARLYVTAPGNVVYSVPLTSVNGSTAQFNYTIPAGDYLYSASAGFRYTTDLNHSFRASSGQTTALHLRLTKTFGSITGSVALAAGATQAGTAVSVNGTSVPVDAFGTFTESVPWGYYWVNATNPRTTSYAPVDPIVVTSNQVTRLSISLIGGWIEGLLYAAPGPVANLTVTVNGSSAGVRIVGATYNWSGPTGQTAARGWYWVSATEPGYNTTKQYVYVAPGVATLLNLYISDHAAVVGQIQPLDVVQNIRNNSLSIRFENQTDGLVYYVSTYDRTTGGFNVTVRGGADYRVTVSAKGYQTLTLEVLAVPAGATSPLLSIALISTGQNCSGTNPCLTPTSPSGLGLSTWLTIGVALAALGLTGIAIWARRREGGHVDEDETEPPPS